LTKHPKMQGGYIKRRKLEGWHTCRPAPKRETLAYTETARRRVNTGCKIEVKGLRR